MSRPYDFPFSSLLTPGGFSLTVLFSVPNQCEELEFPSRRQIPSAPCPIQSVILDYPREDTPTGPSGPVVPNDRIRPGPLIEVLSLNVTYSGVLPY